MKHLIIGGSIAGISAMRSIRSRDSASDITVVTAEQGRAYYRPLIPYLIETSDRNISMAVDPYKTYGATVVYGSVVAVNTNSMKVKLTGGESHSYDRLLIASGASPLIPEVVGIRGTGCFQLRTAQDAFTIARYTKGRRQALIIGAGLVGIKAAVSLKAIGLKVTLVEKLDRILSGRIDARGAAILKRKLEDNGFNIRTKTTVSRVLLEADAASGVMLACGDRIDADVVIIASGNEPNISFLRGSGITVSRGIVVNERLETNITGVYAAGDVAEYIDVVSGKPAISALWTTAGEMGSLAGVNMAGGSLKYHGFLATMNATDILGIPFVSVGMIEPDYMEYEVFVDDRLGSYRKLVFKDNRLAGFVLLGDLEGAGIYTNLIRSRRPLGELKDDAIGDTLKAVRFLSSAVNSSEVGVSL